MKIVLVMIFLCFQVLANDLVNISLSKFTDRVSKQTNKNIYIDEDINSTISLYVPDKISDKDIFSIYTNSIFKNGFNLRKIGNVYYLSKQKKYKIKNYLFQLSYNCSDDFKKYLLFYKYQFTYFISNNTFLVSCNYIQKKSISNFLKSLDKQAKQVMLKFIIISYDDNLQDKKGITLSNSYIGLDGTVKTAINSLLFPLSSARNIISSTSFYSAIQFLNSRNKIDIKQFPYVLVQNNHKFKFESVQNIPYLTKNTKTDSNTVQNNNSYEYKDVGLKIYGTANILKNFVTLDLDLTIEDLINTSGDNLTPSTNKRYLNSITNLKYGQILLLSGIKQKKVEQNDIRVPVLCNIPYLGKMFTYDYKTHSSSNITIAIEVLDSSKPVFDSKADALSNSGEVRAGG